MKITEALQEVRTIDKRLQAKMKVVQDHLVRPKKMVDPMEKEGGSPDLVKRQMQAIRDLIEHRVKVRLAVVIANLKTPLRIEGRERTIQEWLIYRREVADLERQFLGNLVKILTDARKQAARLATDEREGVSALADLTVNINERELREQQETLEKQLSELDGQLSLLNALTEIEEPSTAQSLRDYSSGLETLQK